MKRAAIVAAAVGLILSNLPAQAKHKHYFKRHYNYHKTYTKNYKQSQRQTLTILPHPIGCPKTAYCGCGTAVEVFGEPIRDLWLASSWFKFPKAEPAPGMVAVRQNHVFKIEAVLGPNTVLAKNHNGGGHKSYLQVLSLNGYSVRNPKG